MISVSTMHVPCTLTNPCPTAQVYFTGCKLSHRRRQQPHKVCYCSDEQHTQIRHAIEKLQIDAVDSIAVTTAHPPLTAISRRELIRSTVTGTIASSAPILLPEFAHVPPAEAIPITFPLPPIGQAAPGKYNFGVAAVRDPALYRLNLSLQVTHICMQHWAKHQTSSQCLSQGHGH